MKSEICTPENGLYVQNNLFLAYRLYLVSLLIVVFIFSDMYKNIACWVHFSISSHYVEQV